VLSLRHTLALALACGTLAAGPAVAESAEIPANWQRHEIEFTYMGFTTRYSCDGLRDKMKLLLRHAGARPDFKVSTRACADGPGRVTQFPRVRMVFFTPRVPALGQRELGEPTAARWRPVLFVRRQPRELEVGDCELVEQFRDRVLPSFTTRKVSSDIHCIPHQLSGSSFSLRFEVLEGLPEPDAPAQQRS
jgi:hypothetical protein